MTTQHTPGPWKAQGSRIVQAGKMEAWQLIIASLPTTIDPRPTPDAAAKEYATRDANARLIATAPDLLATLRIIHANAAESVEWIRRHTAEAIAKATGEEVPA